MASKKQNPNDYRPAGYSWLVEHFQISCLPYWVNSFVGGSGRRTECQNGSCQEYYSTAYWPGDRPGDHLEFALKFEGMNFQILNHSLGRWDDQELTAWIQEKPTSRFRRICWFLLEEWHEERLQIPDLKQGNYVRLLDPAKYITGQEVNSARHRVRCNWLGNRRFCPIVRRSELLEASRRMGLQERARAIVEGIPPKLLERATEYLYKKETRSSYRIEQEKPSRERMETFIDLLMSADSLGPLNEQALVELNQRILDERYAAESFRTFQNYIGASQGPHREMVHFIPPRPEAVPELMLGFEACAASILGSGIDPIIAATIISYAFVYLHPFEDGNGRTHRFLIHHVLAKMDFTPKNLVFPISATLLNHPQLYDESLEAFSKPLMRCTKYKLDHEGRCEVLTPTRDYFRFLDFTPQCSWMFEFIRMTLEEELLDEIDFLERYDRVKIRLRDIVDMPNQRMDLFIRLARQNQGTLAKRKRNTFSELSDEEVRLLGDVITEVFFDETMI